MKATSLIKPVYQGIFNTRAMPEHYYRSVRAGFQSALKTGFGPKAGLGELYTSLSENVSMFAAAKTYQLTRELQQAAKVFKPDDYQTEAKAIVAKYERWGEAELTTITGQAQQAKQWQSIEEDKDLFPNLRYSTIGKACDICAPLDGIVAPVDALIWKTRAPLNHYSCFCILIQEEADVQCTHGNRIAKVLRDTEDSIDPVFKHNAGITGEVFNKEHPYFTEVPRKDRGFAKRNFDLPL